MVVGGKLETTKTDVKFLLNSSLELCQLSWLRFPVCMDISETNAVHCLQCVACLTNVRV